MADNNTAKLALTVTLSSDEIEYLMDGLWYEYNGMDAIEQAPELAYNHMMLENIYEAMILGLDNLNRAHKFKKLKE